MLITTGAIRAGESATYEEASSEDEDKVLAKGLSDGSKNISKKVQSPNDEASSDEGLNDTDDLSEDSDNDSMKTDDEAGHVKKRKRNDPSAFATSMSKILNSKLTNSKRADPVLSRSKDATTASKEISESKLEAKAKHKLRQEKRLRSIVTE